MARWRTFSIRVSEDEYQTLNFKAQSRGWSLGKYLRFRALAPETGKDQKIVAAHELLKSIVEGIE